MNLETSFKLYFSKPTNVCINEVLSGIDAPGGGEVWHTPKTGIKNYEGTDAFNLLFSVFEKEKFSSLKELKKELAEKGFPDLAEELEAEETPRETGIGNSGRGFIKFYSNKEIPILFGSYILE